MHSFSADPKRVEFFLYIIREVIYHQKMNGILGVETVLNELEALNIFFVPYKRFFSNPTVKHPVVD